MFIELTPDQTRLLIKAAELRVVGRSWDQTARLLDYDTEELTELARESGPAYDKILATVDRGSTREARQEANLTLREQLRNADAKVVQNAANIISRTDCAYARLEPQHAKLELAEKQLELAQFKAELAKKKLLAELGEQDEAQRDPFPQKSNNYHDWFPPTSDGADGKSCYEYVKFATPEELAADRDRDFRKQCYIHNIQHPDEPPLPYWKKPGYNGPDAKGWLKGDQDYDEYHFGGVRGYNNELYPSDFYRKMTEYIKGPEDGDEEEGGTPVPREPKPPADGGGASGTNATGSCDPNGVAENSQGCKPLVDDAKNDRSPTGATETTTVAPTGLGVSGRADQGLRCAPPLAINGDPVGVTNRADPEGVAENSQGCKPLVDDAKNDRSPTGATETTTVAPSGLGVSGRADQGLRCAPPLAIHGDPVGVVRVETNTGSCEEYSLHRSELLAQVNQRGEAVRVQVGVVEGECFAAVGGAERVQVGLAAEFGRLVGGDGDFQAVVGPHTPVVGGLAVEGALPVLPVGPQGGAGGNPELHATVTSFDRVLDGRAAECTLAEQDATVIVAERGRDQFAAADRLRADQHHEGELGVLRGVEPGGDVAALPGPRVGELHLRDGLSFFEKCSRDVCAGSHVAAGAPAQVEDQPAAALLGEVGHHLLDLVVEARLDWAEADVADLVRSVEHAVPLLGVANRTERALGVVHRGPDRGRKRHFFVAAKGDGALLWKDAAGFFLKHQSREREGSELTVDILSGDLGAVEVADDVARLHARLLRRAARHHAHHPPRKHRRAGHGVHFGRRAEVRIRRKCPAAMPCSTW